MRIETDDLSRPQVHELLREHLRHMHEQSPPESVHALDLDKLRHPSITFWTAWDRESAQPDNPHATLLGCGALKELDATHGEVKSMRTPTALRRTGAGRALLLHIISTAQARGYQRLSLETGSQAGFAPARTLYASHGFVDCGKFADYQDDPYSVFMTLLLQKQ